MLSLQASAMKRLWQSISHEEKEDLLDDFIIDVGYVTWFDPKYDDCMLRAIIKMYAARIITKKTLMRMKCLLFNILFNQSKQKQYTLRERKKFIFHSNYVPAYELEEGTFESLKHVIKDHGLDKICIASKRLNAENKEEIIFTNISYIVFHYNQCKNLLVKDGYDLSMLEEFDEENN